MSIYYQDESVTLYHGDCLETLDWARADVLVTDPPYGIAYRQGRNSGHAHGKAEMRRRQAALREQGHLHIKADSDTDVRDRALRFWGEDRPGLVFGSWRQPRPENTRQRLLWVKDDSPFSTGLTKMPWITGDEEIYVVGSSLTQFIGKPRKGYYITHEQRSAEVSKIGHPTPKPLGLMTQLIEKCPEGVIADPFAGSGSTLIAARTLGRKAIGVEVEERYCELIAKRLSQGVLTFDSEAIA